MGLRENMARQLGIGIVAFWFLLCAFRVPRSEAGPVIWDLVETSCYSTTGGCPTGSNPFTLPLTIGSIQGSGSYVSNPFGEFSESGDFFTQFGGYHDFSAVSAPYCTEVFKIECDVAINLTSTSVGVNGGIDFTDGLTAIGLNLFGSTFSGTWGSDGPLEGCGADASCQISGNLVYVPEPASWGVLAAAFIGLILIGSIKGIHLRTPSKA